MSISAMKMFRCGSGEMGTLYWSKDGRQSEMKAVTEEQFAKIDIRRDENGLIVSASLKEGIIQ